MPNLTTNFSLNKPLVNNATDQDLWGGYLNDNMDTIDTQLLLCRDWKKRAITGTDSMVAADRHKMLLCDATSAAFAETLLAAATAGDGFEFTAVKTDASGHSITLTPTGADTIAGAATWVLSGQGDSATLVSDGVATWSFKGNKTTPSAVASASTTTQGIIEIATDAEFQAGTDTARAITAGNVKAGLGYSTYYDSGEQTFSNGTLITLTHGLGAVPKHLICELVCKTEESGFSVDDKYLLFSQTGTTGNVGFAVLYNATQIKAIPGSSGIQNINSSGSFDGTINPANWKLVVRAWA